MPNHTHHFNGRIVAHDALEAAMIEYESPHVDEDRVPFTEEELDVMAENPCEFGYHSFTLPPDASAEDREMYEGLTCVHGCGYGIG